MIDHWWEAHEWDWTARGCLAAALVVTWLVWHWVRAVRDEWRRR